MSESSPRIEVAPFRRSDELRDTLIASFDQLPQPLTVVDPAFEVCGREEGAILAVASEGQLVVAIPFMSGRPVRAEEVVVAIRTVENFLPWIARIHPRVAVDVDRSPRPVVVAEAFSPETVALIERLYGGASCIVYTPLRVGDCRAMLLQVLAVEAGEESLLPPFRDGVEAAWDYLDAEEKRLLFG
jgi:hypothetical protein